MRNQREGPYLRPEQVLNWKAQSHANPESGIGQASLLALMVTANQDTMLVGVEMGLSSLHPTGFRGMGIRAKASGDDSTLSNVMLVYMIHV